MWVKAAILAAVVTISGGAVFAYSKAIERAEQLAAANQILLESAAEEKQARLKVERVLLEREAVVEVIHETEIKTVEVIRTVQGECLDVRMPFDLISRLRNGSPDSLQDGAGLSPGTAVEELSFTRF